MQIIFAAVVNAIPNALIIDSLINANRYPTKKNILPAMNIMPKAIEMF